MCGIFGFAKNGNAMADFQIHQLRGAVLDLAYHNETRGRDGTGLALISSSAQTLFKEAAAVSGLLKTRRFQKTIRAIASDTLLCLGHTRMATIGSVKDSHCHPFVSEEFIGVHNGHFLNREALLKKYGRSVETEVDSEAIFRVLDGEAEPGAIASRLEEMTGDFALGFAQMTHPDRLYLIRNGVRPLHLAYVRKLRTLLWSSEAKHLEFALVRNNFKARVWQLAPDRLCFADVHAFNGKSNLESLPCRIEMPKLDSGRGAWEGDFRTEHGVCLYSFEELQSLGFLEGSEINERSKIPCSCCEIEVEAGRLFYDEMSRRFICEECSFDDAGDWEEKRQKEEGQDTPYGKETIQPYLW